MATFKAIVIEKSEAGQKVGLTDFDDDNLMDGGRHNQRRMVDAQLQGRAGDHWKGAGRAPLSDDPRDRLCRHGGSLDPS